jgi:hypothetical protein
LPEQLVEPRQRDLSAGAAVAVEEPDPDVREMEDRRELLVHLPEHEVEGPAEVDVLDRPLDRRLLAGLDALLIAGVDLDVALGRGAL